MTMKRKSPGQIKREIQHQILARTGPIAERFPTVKRVNFDFTFDDPDKKVQTIPPEKLFRGPEQPAFFQFSCPIKTCEEGGFDLSGPTGEMLQAGSTEAAGSLQCHGWLGARRIGPNRCFCKLTYRITAEY